MSLQLDNSLSLIYKNMVGLSNIIVDQSANTFLNAKKLLNQNYLNPRYLKLFLRLCDRLLLRLRRKKH